MKTGIHPDYLVAQVSCACGNAFTTRSTKPSIKLEICSACHPYYTGRQKLMDTAGRLEKFKKRFAKTEGQMVERKPIAELKQKKLVSAKAPKKVLRSTPVKEPKEDKPKKKA